MGEQGGSEWYCVVGGKQYGPIGEQELQSWRCQSRIVPTTLVWKEGMANWQAMGATAELGGACTDGTIAVPPIQPPAPPEQGKLADSAGVRMLLPVGRSGWAIAAGYLGLISVIPIFSPLAIIFSAIAMWHLKKHPDKHGWGRAIFGMIMGVGFFVILLVFLISPDINL